LSTSSDPVAALTALRAVESGVAREAGGYLRNPVSEPGLTCAVCRRPLDPGATALCPPCASAERTWSTRLSDRTGFITYAGISDQSTRLMYGYKAQAPVPEHTRMMTLLLVVALKAHARCPAVLAEAPVTRWCTVPSLSRRGGRHPLNAIVSGIARGGELRLEPGPDVDPFRARDIDASHFAVPPLDPGQHVLLIDDTWTSGGHAQSAAAALKVSGASQVSTLVVARWLRSDYPATAALWRSRIATSTYRTGTCPWTSGGCP